MKKESGSGSVRQTQSFRSTPFTIAGGTTSGLQIGATSSVRTVTFKRRKIIRSFTSATMMPLPIQIGRRKGYLPNPSASLLLVEHSPVTLFCGVMSFGGAGKWMVNTHRGTFRSATTEMTAMLDSAPPHSPDEYALQDMASESWQYKVRANDNGLFSGTRPFCRFCACSTAFRVKVRRKIRFPAGTTAQPIVKSVRTIELWVCCRCDEDSANDRDRLAACVCRCPGS